MVVVPHFYGVLGSVTGVVHMVQLVFNQMVKLLVYQIVQAWFSYYFIHPAILFCTVCCFVSFDRSNQ